VLLYAAATAANQAVGGRMLEVSCPKALAAGAGLIAGVVEEAIFRGYVITAVAGLRYGPVLQVLAGGLALGLAQVYAFGICRRA
jgi:membrane protease YdiL (CAAX protease family)